MKRKTAVRDADAWVKSSARRPSRICETCAWGKANPEDFAFLERALELRRSGAVSFTYPSLHDEMVRRSSTKGRVRYPLSMGAMYSHSIRCVPVS